MIAEGPLRPEPALLRPAASRRTRVAGLIALIAVGNAVLGVAAGFGSTAVVLLVGALPLLAIAVAWLLAGHRHAVVYVALALPMMPGQLNQRLPGTGGTAIYPADILVMLALAIWVVERFVTPSSERAPAPRTPVLGWPLVLFSLAVFVGIVHGHDNYGEHYFDQASRLPIYAGIAPALVGLSVQRAYRAVSMLFYAGIVVQVLVGLYYLATGASQTASVNLSTGGTRALALTTAIWLGAGLILALLNLERAESSRQRFFHLAFVGLAVFGVVISFSRTTFAAAGLLVPVLFLLFRRLRRSVLEFLPLFLPVAVLGVILALQLAPSLGTTLGKRLSGTPTNDPSLIQRERKWTATLHGFGQTPLFGFGFGRPVQFTQIDRHVRTINGDPENSYIWILAGGGIAAFSAFMLLIAAFFTDAIRRAVRARGEARALIVFSMALAFILLVNTATYPLLSSPPQLLVLWIAFLLPRLARRNPAGVPSPLQ